MFKKPPPLILETPPSVAPDVGNEAYEALERYFQRHASSRRLQETAAAHLRTKLTDLGVTKIIEIPPNSGAYRHLVEWLNRMEIRLQ
jgi:hypothetical protein